MMETFVNYAVELLVNVFDMYIIYRYMNIFFGDKFANKKLAIVMYGVRFSVLFVCGAIVISPMISSSIYIITVFSIACYYSAGLLKKIIVTVMIFMFAFVGDSMIALFVGLSSFDLLGETKQMDAFYKVIMELIFWAITLIVQRFQNVNNNISISKAFVVAIIVIPISSVYLEYLIFQQKDVNSSMAGLSLLCILATNFILIYLYDSLSRMFQERTRAAIVEREKEYYHEQAQVLKKQHEELRQFRHDYKNRMVVIEQMINDNKYDRVLEYSKLIVEKLDRVNVYSSTGNLAMDSVINYKLSRAKELGIKVKSDIILPDKLQIDEDDIVVILGNLLDNAIEAAQRLIENRYIYIDVGYDKGNMLIHMENSYDSVLYQDKNKFITRKKDVNFHGIGLESVNAIVEKYDGELEIENNTKIFIVDVLLYL